MTALLEGAGLEPSVRTWGFPVVRLYDALFLKRVNRRRLETDRPLEADPSLRTVQRLGRKRWLVALVRTAFSIDRLFGRIPLGVGLIFSARKPAGSPDN
jgi:hypothetical protein